MSGHRFSVSQLGWYWKHLRNKIVRSSLGPTLRQLSGAERLSPSFFIVGAQKAGTTFLHRTLGQHHAVAEPWRKELHFFDINFDRGLRWYNAYFPTVAEAPGKITGESTPTYMFHPLAAERMSQLYPDAKLIVLVREPASRALSQYQMALFRGKEPLSFADALAKEDERLEGEVERILADPSYPGFRYLQYSYKTRGLYLEQLLRLERHYPKEKILVMNSKELFQRSDEALHRVEDFLGLDRWHPKEYKAEAVSKVKADVPSGVVEDLRSFFKPHDEALFQHLGWTDGWETVGSGSDSAAR